MNLLNPHVVKQETTCWACPVQIEGRLDDGRNFYFRYRHGWAQLGVGETEGDAVAQTHTEDCAGMPFGDHLQGVFESDEDLNGVFDSLLNLHRLRHGPLDLPH